MKREIIITKDGSSSVFVPDLNETYHSKNGAIQEAYYVYIDYGLNLIQNKTEINILEIGFGTGLNALVTLLEAEKRNLKINYVGVEAYPFLADEAAQLNYIELLEKPEKKADFDKMHACNWEEKIKFNDNFNLTKRKQLFENITDFKCYDLIYFDAFGFFAQPNLWETPTFKIMYNALKKNGVLSTYACRLSIIEAMENAGFTTEKKPGPPGKHEMLVAVKK
jgi:tRNA U34 5-methylaminomethyl-2-thiouridine-forming methyltransferase MnmC